MLTLYIYFTSKALYITGANQKIKVTNEHYHKGNLGMKLITKTQKGSLRK